jgi:hypothetical protein
MAPKVHAPVEDYEGDGPGVDDDGKPVHFENGVATVASSETGALAWYEANGYGVGSKKASDPVEHPVDVLSTDAEVNSQVGTPLRDAAVDPQPEDYLAPINAGKADPHGPEVISPGIHATQGIRAVRPGRVPQRSAQQDAAEKEAAAKAPRS